MLQIAKILKSNGTDGGILVGLCGCVLEEINLQEPVYVEFDGLPVPFFILDALRKGNSRAVLHLNDVRSLGDAEELVGRAIFCDRSGDEEKPEDDITGWTVYNRDILVGTVSGDEPIPGNYCIYVGDIMIPLHEDLVLEVNEKTRTLRLDLPDGLL